MPLCNAICLIKYKDPQNHRKEPEKQQGNGAGLYGLRLVAFRS